MYSVASIKACEVRTTDCFDLPLNQSIIRARYPVAHRVFIIARPTSDGGSIALAVSLYLRQSFSPHPAPIISPPIFVPAHPRNRHRRVAGRCCRGQRNRRLVPQPTRAAGSGGRATGVIGFSLRGVLDPAFLIARAFGAAIRRSHLVMLFE